MPRGKDKTIADKARLNQPQGRKPINGTTEHQTKMLPVPQSFWLPFEKSVEATVLYDPENAVMIAINDAARHLLGFEKKDPCPLAVSQLHPNQESVFNAFAGTVQAAGQCQTDQLFFEGMSGRKLPVTLFGVGVTIKRRAAILAFVGQNMVKSGTERLLWESEQRFGALIENMQEGVMIVDNDDVIKFGNRRIYEMLEYAYDDLIGKTGYRVLFRESDQGIIREKNQLRTQKVSDQYEVQMLKKNGDLIWVQISGVPIVDASGEVSGSFGIITDITERKLAEEALKKAHYELEQRVAERTSELLESNETLKSQVDARLQLEAEREKLIALVENSNDFIAMLSLEGELSYINESGKRLLGIRNQQLPAGMKLEDCHPAAMRGHIREIILPSIVNKGVWTGDSVLQHIETGKHIPTLLNGFPVLHPETGKIIGIAVIYRDITARKRAEEELQRVNDLLEQRVEERTAELSQANQVLKEQIVERERAEKQLLQSEKRYRMLFNRGNDAILVHYLEANGEEGPFVEANDVACQKLGYSREELLRMSPRSISLNYQADLHRSRIAKLKLANHILYENVFLTRKGSKIPVEMSAHLMTFNDRPAIMLIARDTTARKRAENQIREQAALLDKAQDAIMVCDLNDYIIYWNKSAERLYGWRMEEIIGNNVFELLFKNSANQFIGSRRAVLENEEWQGELNQMTKEGRQISVESRWTLVHDANGEAKSILVVNTDITEKKKIEAQFLRAQRMESIGALAGGIAHDLNNVLAPILTAVQILEVKHSDEKSQRILNTIESNVKRGADMVKQILTFARGVEGERIPIKLLHLIHDLEKIVLETFPKSIRIQITPAARLWNVAGDATQLHQVLLNLCVNARDAMPDGGLLTVTAENRSLGEDFVRSNLEAEVGDYVMITVRDTGVGIPADIITKIFEPFFTTKEPGKGTGLGLSTVIAIVKSHDGFVNVLSDDDGSVFEVYLPALRDYDPVEEDNDDVNLPAGNGELILVVDDETSILEITRETLETYGYTVMVAADGAEAVGMYAQYKDDIRVVITDMMMPVMDGGATIRAMRKINGDVRIIASSGYMENARVSEYVESGVDAFLHKPYTAEKLLETIYEIL